MVPDPVTGPLLPELVLDSAASGSPLRVSGLQGSSPSWAVASQLEALGAPVLWVCATARDAELRLAELRFHAQGTEAEVTRT